jgi:uncharacterized protein
VIRGIAVLGILAVNIAGFAGPVSGTLTPSALAPASPADEIAFALTFVLFEGKMRALFTLLFGAGLVLFVERAEAAGRPGDKLQLRRLGWLALFGYLHFALLWWGDILFTYAVLGALALPLRHLRPRVLVAAALMLFAAMHLMDASESLPAVVAEETVRSGNAGPDAMAQAAQAEVERRQSMEEEMAQYRRGFYAHAVSKLAGFPEYPIRAAISALGETLPLIAIGMALLKSGFFTGGWSRSWLRVTAALGIIGGGTWTLGILSWVMPRHFPLEAMAAAIAAWNAPAHLTMALGYLAVLALAMPWLDASGAGRAIVAAGRMAFSNYIGTSVVMCAIFYGWGLGLVGQVPWAWQWPFVLLGWALMLGASVAWLTHFRQGPLEWLWRSLTEGQALPLRRDKSLAIESNSH